MDKRRAALIGGWVVLVAAVLAAVPLAVWPRLPEPMATHWGTTVDGAMSRPAHLVFTLVLWLVVAVIMVAIDVYGNRPATAGRGRRIAVPVLAGLGVLLAGVEVWTVRANLDRTNWHDAPAAGWTFVLPLLAGLVAGYGGWVLDRRIEPPRPAPREGERPRLDLRAGERVAWTGGAVNGLMTRGGAVLAVLGAAAVVLAVLGPVRVPAIAMIVMIVLLVVGIALLAIGRIRVTADARGLRVVFGPFGWPVQRVALDRITDVTVQDLRPMEVGGWGYRGLPGSAAVMLRGGPCLVVRYDEGRSRLTISVDRATEAASVLNGLRPTPATS